MKRCPKCGEIKSADEYHKNRSQKSGLASRCKACACAEKKLAYNDPDAGEKMREAHRESERRKRADPIRNEQTLQFLRDKRKNDPEWRAERNTAQREQRVRNLPKHLIRDAKRRAATRGLECTVTEEQIARQLPLGCEYTGAAFTVGCGKYSDTSASLDALDPAVGYTPENTVLCSWKANSDKRTSSPAQLRLLADQIDAVAKKRGLL